MREVALYAGSVFLKSAPVNDDGTWDVVLDNLDHKVYEITARMGENSSSPRVFRVLEPLTIDTSFMRLSGLVVLTSLPLSGYDSAGTTMIRNPVGGALPYVYRSDNPSVAMVDQTGLVRSSSNGVASITVSDALGASVSYPVEVTNVYRLIETTGPYDYNEAMQWRERQSGVFIANDLEFQNKFMRAINLKYIGAWAASSPHWYGTSGFPNAPYGFVNSNGVGTGAAGIPNYPGIVSAVCFVMT